MKSIFSSWLNRILSIDVKELTQPVLHQFEGLRFVVGSTTSEPYNLVDPSKHTETCNGYSLDSDKLRCSFELINIRGTVLTVNHFAVQGDWIGKGKAELCLRAFAQMIAAQAPHITTIQFELYKVRIRPEIANNIQQKLVVEAKSLKDRLTAGQIKQTSRELQNQLEDEQVLKLTRARVNFLNTIGAKPVNPGPKIRNSCGELRITVSGTWLKDKWTKTD